MSINNLLLWEKYRPKSLKQIILLPRIQDIIDVGIVGNMVFYGASGTGKTSLARILAKEHNSLVLKGKLGIDILTTKIEEHFRALNFDNKDGIKLIVIDEFDNASSALQDAMKSFQEDYPSARFIFTTNHIDKINPELLSRFTKIPFEPVDSFEREFLFEKQVNYLRAIAKREENDLYKDVDEIKNIVKKNFPDLRASVELLHLVMLTGNLSSASSEYGSTKDELFQFIIDGNVNPLLNYDFVMNNFFITFDDAFKYLSRPFFEYLKEFHVQTVIDKGALVLKKQKEYNETLHDTLDPLVHLVNYIIDLKTVIS